MKINEINGKQRASHFYRGQVEDCEDHKARPGGGAGNLIL